MALTEANIRKKLQTNPQADSLPDSPNLRLDVGETKPNQSRRYAAWVVRITRNGRTTKTTVGHWPAMTVERAHRERDRLTGQNIDLAYAVAEAVDDYRHLVTDDLKSGWQSEVYLRHFVAMHGHRRIATMSRAELVTIVKNYSNEHGSRSADRYLSQLRGILNLTVEQGLIEVSPLFGVSSRITGYKPSPRSRLLSPDEIRELWTWDHPNAALLRFLLLTGIRISEAQKGHRDGDRWIIPAFYSKSKRAHWVYLTDSALVELATPFDRSPTAVQAWLRRKLPEGDRWTPHDCRRSASTMMHDNGVQPFIVERALGHMLGGLMAVYNHAEYEDERIEAAAILEHSVLNLVENEPKLY